MSDAVRRDLLALARAIARHYRASVGSPGGDGPDSSMLADAADRMERCTLAGIVPGGGKRKPVSRYVHAAATGAQSGPLADLALAFAAVEPEADWLQNPNYTAASMGAEFVDRYGYVELVGPGRPIESRDLLVGFLLLGPGVTYPDHNHPASETYHVVSGTASWWREGRDWQRLPPGTAIHHAPLVRHAMRTEAAPLLALYCWAGRIGVAARLVTGG